MKIVEDILYIQVIDFLKAGWSEDGIKKANYRNGARWQMIPDPSDARAVLVQYDTLTDRHKEKLIATFGDPYLYIAKSPIRALVTTDFKAQEFYIAHRFDGGKSLPEEYIRKYTVAASWLSMLVRLNSDKKFIKNQLHLSLEKFYSTCIDIIKSEGIDLPTSYRFLTDKMRQFKTEGYGCLISKHFGNDKAKKVTDDVAESLLLELIAHPNQYDDVFIAWQYNEWAGKNDRLKITDQTVRNYRIRNSHTITTGREGNAEFYNTFVPQVKRLRPTDPLLMVNHDDNHLDLFYIDHEQKGHGKYFNKYKSIVVIDTFNDLVLGYAYDLSISNDLIRRAYLNAMYYIRELTGGWHLPHEIKSDRFGSAELTPFYHSMGHYFNTPVGSKGSGYIEQCFSRPFFKRCVKLGANNYTGNNVSAKFTGVNREALDLNKKLRPSVDEAAMQIETIFHRMRNWPSKEGGISKQQEWLNAWNIMPEDRKKPISDETFLITFGAVAHDRGITITNRGVEPQINNIQYSYDLPQTISSKYIGMKVSVVYDPLDMSRVLLTNFNDFRCIATSPKYVPSALADYTDGSRTELNRILELKRQQVEYAASQVKNRKKILETNNINPEAILQAGVSIPKLLKQKAEEQYASDHTAKKDTADQHHKYLNEEIDINQYL